MKSEAIKKRLVTAGGSPRLLGFIAHFGLAHQTELAQEVVLPACSHLEYRQEAALSGLAPSANREERSHQL